MSRKHPFCRQCGHDLPRDGHGYFCSPICMVPAAVWAAERGYASQEYAQKVRNDRIVAADRQEARRIGRERA